MCCAYNMITVFVVMEKKPVHMTRAGLILKMSLDRRKISGKENDLPARVTYLTSTPKGTGKVSVKHLPVLPSLHRHLVFLCLDNMLFLGNCTTYYIIV